MMLQIIALKIDARSFDLKQMSAGKERRRHRKGKMFVKEISGNDIFGCIEQTNTRIITWDSFSAKEYPSSEYLEKKAVASKLQILHSPVSRRTYSKSI
jgi:hypothetical protein